MFRWYLIILVIAVALLMHCISRSADNLSSKLNDRLDCLEVQAQLIEDEDESCT